MKTRLVLACAVAGLAATAFGAAQASATGATKGSIGFSQAPYSAIGIQDREIKPGQEVMIVASCEDKSFTSSKVTSSVLTSPDLVRRANSDPTSPAIVLGHINKDARPGKYSLSFICVGKKVSGTFTIVGTPAKGQVPVKPKGAPETGGDPYAVAGDA